MIAVRSIVALVFASVALQADAQSFVTMGRLFTTPDERAQLDQLRNSGAALPQASGGGPGTPGVAGAAPMGGGAGAPGAAAGAGTSAEAPPPPPPEPVQLTGMIRRSGGHTTIFVNDEARDARPADNGKAARVRIDGRTVVLKPGQTYDPATGAVHEAGK